VSKYTTGDNARRERGTSHATGKMRKSEGQFATGKRESRSEDWKTRNPHATEPGKALMSDERNKAAIHFPKLLFNTAVNYPGRRDE